MKKNIYLNLAALLSAVSYVAVNDLICRCLYLAQVALLQTVKSVTVMTPANARSVMTATIALTQTRAPVIRSSTDLLCLNFRSI